MNLKETSYLFQMASKAVSYGLSTNIDISWESGLKAILGATLMEVQNTEDGLTTRQQLSERFSGVWSLGYTFGASLISINYTGNVYSPMLLPLLDDTDTRNPESPWWSIQNIQISKKFVNGLEVYGGVKNILNYTPPSNSIASADNPFSDSFDAAYVFAPNQGTKTFLGLRLNLK